LEVDPALCSPLRNDTIISQAEHTWVPAKWIRKEGKEGVSFPFVSIFF
jgi:hypothetical protein